MVWHTVESLSMHFNVDWTFLPHSLLISCFVQLFPWTSPTFICLLIFFGHFVICGLVQAGIRLQEEFAPFSFIWNWKHCINLLSLVNMEKTFCLNSAFTCLKDLKEISIIFVKSRFVDCFTVSMILLLRFLLFPES